MGRINILDSSVYNKISAGEVVTEPYGVVKELVENSIDAGATKITIEIENGGLNLIRVTDNGCGIENSDVKKAFLAHSTSKIATADDVLNIHTLGFRGEALASIAAVSKTTMLTKTKEEEIGTYLEIDGGIITELVEKAATTGTVISVSNLFYNIPARFKFLKRPSSEQAEITKLVTRLALSHPNIDIHYIVNGTSYYHSPATGLKDVIYSVFGKNFAENMIEAEFDGGFVKVHGYLSTPYMCKKTSSGQYIFVNNRWVENDGIKMAIQSAYEVFSMLGTKPQYVLNIEVPFNEVDVNITPTKNNVKFEKEQLITTFIYQQVTEAIHNYNKKLEFNEMVELFNSTGEQEEIIPSQLGSSFNESDEDQTKELCVPTAIRNKLEGKLLEQYYNSVVQDQAENERKYEESLNSDSDIYVDLQRTFIKDNPESNAEVNVQVDFNQTEMFDSNEYKILGTIFATYILVEQGETLYILDEHAVHERLLYDKLTESFENQQNVSQQLLVPYIVHTDIDQFEFLKENTDRLKDLGFDLEPFGNSVYRVNAVPLILSDINLDNFFADVFTNLKFLSGHNIQLKNKLATKACRSAVKAGKKLDVSEIKKLLDSINDSNSPLTCPHGRPYMVKITKSDIEKWFKRLV